MKIVADESLSLVKEYFGHAGELVLKPGRSITRDDVMTADILLVRSVTQVDSSLLEGTAVKFVGSATSGMDHLDTDWLSAAGIQWYAAEGCNTVAVVEYVIAAIAAMKKLAMLPDRKLRAAVVGAGRIGSLVAEKLELLGFDVECCDPLRAEREPGFVSTALGDLKNLDLITFHTPLTFDGQYPTHHLIKKEFLLRQKKNCVLLNASRGAVIDFSDLEEYGQHLYWCLDVWEYEPHINFEILDLAALATPHIAGYSLQSKQRGTEMVYQAACEKKIIPPVSLAVPAFATQSMSFANATVDWTDVVLKIYDPQTTTAIMKNDLVENGSNATFDLLRKQFPARYEFAFVSLQDLTLADADKTLLNALGIDTRIRVPQ